jgi:hypothetical protein
MFSEELSQGSDRQQLAGRRLSRPNVRLFGLRQNGTGARAS